MKKIKKMFLWFGLFIMGLYFFVLFNIQKLETIASFPAVVTKNKDEMLHYEVPKKFEEINIPDSFGNNINGLYIPGTKKETVFYFHGNGGPLPYFYNEIEYINQLGYSVFSYDYPGYGKSGGYPNKEIVDGFSKNFFSYIKQQKNIKNSELIVWGYSVGTAVATDFASKYDFQKIILVAPFSSRYDMGGKYFFNYPPQKLFFYPNSYQTAESVRSFRKPALIIHGNNDEVIPFSQGKTVYQNYNKNVVKYFVELDGSGHNKIISHYGYAMKYMFLSFLKGNELGFEQLFVDVQTKKKMEEENMKLDEVGEEKEIKNISLNENGETIIQEEKIKNQESIIKNLDFKTDTSFTKFISPQISFDDIHFEPSDLENIKGEFLIDTKGNQTLRKEALEMLNQMATDFYSEFNKKFLIVSAYRDYNYQLGIQKGGCSVNFCAKAGFSEHQTGLAIDLFEVTNKNTFLSKPQLKKYFDWLSENAHIYGFHNSYQKGKDIDGYEIEPWHWRYVRKDLAKYLKEKNMTFGEYMRSLE